MSHYLESAQQAVGAQHHGVPCRATGNHRVAQNDEPEPVAPSEEQLQMADVQLSRNKAQRFHERNDRAALELQVNLSRSAL